MAFEFRVTHRDSLARAGVLHTPHGNIPTPVFAPVGTQATVKTIPPRDLYELNASLILANTYHLHLRPGSELIHELGGLHRFMAWDRPILTDSGGFQVFSLAGINRIDDEGVTFTSHIDGSKHRFTPEVSMRIQENLGADIIMAFDECPVPTERDSVARAVDRTHRWAAQCREAHPDDSVQALFGIVQGGVFPDLRAESAAYLQTLGFPGYAVGGLAVGETKQQMYATLDITVPHLPDDKPRYLMGVGDPDDLVETTLRGIDIYDCVMPTRVARHGAALTHDGRVNAKRLEFARDDRPIEEGCTCYACQHFSRAYIRHLLKADEILGLYLLSLHNVHFLIQHMQRIRRAIEAGRLAEYAAQFLARYRAKAAPSPSSRPPQNG